MTFLTDLLITANAVIVAICQLLAMLVISIGIVKALRIFLRDVLTPGRSAEAIQESRMELGHSFSLALGFLIGASILKTTLAPTWSDIGQLAAIIAIRTILNFFLLHDISIRSQTTPARPAFWSSLFGRGRPPAAPDAGADEKPQS